MRDNKASYQAPALRAEGSLRDITRGNLEGDFLDASFPVNTPKRDLRFS